ncbi:MAG: hypothetical protein WCT22_01820 [Patescibacteria group bacterium]
MISFLSSAYNIFKKTILVGAVFFIIIGLFSYFFQKDKTALSSQADPIKQNRTEINKFLNDKKLNSTKEGKMVLASSRTIYCRIIGEACIKNPNNTEENYQKSMTGFFANLIKTPFANPPASGIAWVYDSLQNTGFVPKSLAAEGVGMSSIRPYADIWKLFRDISYMLLVVFLMAIGFMIMFRTKLNPQTVISVENALPKIVISLILITFSFAIAGFLIDLMYIIISIMISVMSKNDFYYKSVDFKNQYLMSSWFELWTRDVRLRLDPLVSVSGIFTHALLKIIPAQVDVALRTISGSVLLLLLRTWAQPAVDWIVTTLNGIAGFTFDIGNLPQIITYPIAYGTIWTMIFEFGFMYALEIIMTLLMFFSFVLITIRILSLLFSSYLKLIILIILSPILLLFESIGKSSFKYWLMNIIGNLIAFPVTIIIFVISYLIYTQGSSVGTAGRFPYLYGIEASGFKFLIGLGLIFLIPDLVKLLKEALGIKDLPISIGLGTFFGGVSAGVGGSMGLLSQVGSMSLGLTAVKGFKIFGKSVEQHVGDFRSNLAPHKGGGAKGTAEERS